MDYIELIIACIFVNNILLAQFLGNCPFPALPKKWKQPLVWPWRLFSSS